jgi:sporulation protein YlmC with PRC-barrel domain
VVGLPVYLEENGEVLGVVSDIVESKDGKIISYVLENDVSTFNIPVENLLVTKRGLIYTPAWYAEADRFIKTLEIQEALMPDVFVLLAEENVSKEQVKKIMDKGKRSRI